MASVLGSDDNYSLVCIPCHRDEKALPVFGYCIDCNEHLCHFCYTHHKTPTPCRHHRLQDKDDMPSTQRLDTSVHAGTNDSITTPCYRHKKEIIKFYCRDHDKVLCSICVTLEHNKICHVDYIPDILDIMINSQDYKHTMERMDKLLKKCTSIRKETSRDTNTSNNSLKTALTELKIYRQDVNKRIDELQKDLENKIHAQQQHNDERKRTTDTICECIKKTVLVAYDEMKQLNASKQSVQLFIEVKQTRKLLQEYESKTLFISTEDSIDEFKFIPSQEINDVLHKEKMLGDISAKRQVRRGTVATEKQLVLAHHSTVTIPTQHQASEGAASQYQPVYTQHQTMDTSQHKPVPYLVDDSITTACLGEINVKSSEDSERCWITGMAVLPADRLVLVDWMNNSIKLVDVNSKSIISHLSLGTDVKNNGPWDITSITSTKVAVTVPNSYLVQFISVRKPFLSASVKLSKSHTIETRGKCYGICCHQDKLIVTYRNPPKLEILDMKGRVMTRVATDSPTDADIFNGPSYVRANNSTIYVSDEGEGEVIMLNWQGDITGRTTDIHSPRGAAVLADGSVLVCDCHCNIVHQVSSDCSNTSTVLQDVVCPYAVCVDDGGHKLYISRYSIADYNNSILVYMYNI